MSGSDDQVTPAGLEEQLSELLRKANVSFVMGQPSSQQREQEQEGKPEPASPEDRLQPIREFALKPREIKEYLDRFVIRQDEAKKVLSVAICDHYNHVRRCLEDPAFGERDYAKHNILLLGPTGVGKTYLMRCAARLIGVPFVKADATKFSETGYVGHDVEDLVRDLVKAADGDAELAGFGIIYLDEVDKIAAQDSRGGKDVSGRGVQVNLLKLMEETDVSLFSQTDLIGQMQAIMDMQRGKQPTRRTLNTRHILFIASGAFSLLAEQVRRRLRSSRIGFSPGETEREQETEYLRRAETRDFVQFGFEPEFVGRLPVRVVCDALNARDLEQILHSAEGSVLDQYKADFEGYGMQLDLSREALRAVAEMAHREKTGARGLMTVLERLLRGYKYELPSTAVRTVTLDEQAVGSPGEALADLLRSRESARRERLRQEIEEYAQRFQRNHGLRVAFNKAAMDALIEICIGEDRSARAVCGQRFQDLEYGLRLIARNTGRTSFTLTRKIVQDPAGELSRRVADSFRKRPA